MGELGMGSRWLAAVAALLAAGCGGTSPFHADASFTEAERAEVLAGIKWLYAHIGEPAPEVVFDVDGTCENQHIVRRERVGGSYHGQCLEIGVWQPEHMPAIAAHEMGHFLGFRHVDREPQTALMSAVAWLVWTDADEAECKRAGFCLR